MYLKSLRVGLISEEFPPFSFGGVGLHCFDLAYSLSKKGICTTVFSDRSTNRKLAETIASKLCYNVKDIVFGEYPPRYPIRPIKSDQLYIILDPTKATKELSWFPKTDFDNGLQKTIEYWRHYYSKK